MPADRKPKDLESDDVPAEAESTEDAPLNRAERRARGKARSKQQPIGKLKVTGRRSAAQGPRLWANRRSG